METLLQLAERVEKLTGPSLAADRDIALAIYPGAKPVAGCDARISVWDGNGRTQLTVKPYTALLDAAMSLVPEGWYLHLEQHSNSWSAELSTGLWYDETRVLRDACSTTPALALAAASLRARAAEQKEPSHA